MDIYNADRVSHSVLKSEVTDVVDHEPLCCIWMVLDTSEETVKPLWDQEGDVGQIYVGGWPEFNRHQSWKRCTLTIRTGI